MRHFYKLFNSLLGVIIQRANRYHWWKGMVYW